MKSNISKKASVGKQPAREHDSDTQGEVSFVEEQEIRQTLAELDEKLKAGRQYLADN